MSAPSTGHRVREAQTTALADFASRWWAVALALATVIGAYFQLREEIAGVRAEARETRNELLRLRFWLENPEKFPGRNADGEPLGKGKLNHNAGDNIGQIDLQVLPPPAMSPPMLSAVPSPMLSAVPPQVRPKRPPESPIKRDLGP